MSSERKLFGVLACDRDPVASPTSEYVRHGLLHPHESSHQHNDANHNRRMYLRVHTLAFFHRRQPACRLLCLLWWILDRLPLGENGFAVLEVTACMAL